MLAPTDARAQGSAAGGSASVVGACPQAAHAIFAPLIANGRANPDDAGFALSLPHCRMMVRGYSGTIEVRVASVGGFAGPITLTLADTPGGISGSFAPGAVQAGGTSTLTLNIGSNAAIGSATVTVRGTAGNQVETALLTLIVVEPLVISGRVEFDTGAGIDGAQVTARSQDGEFTAGPVNTGGGNYSLSLPVFALSAKIGIEAVYTGSALPRIANFKWQSFANRGAVQMAVIILPDPQGAELALVNSGAQSVNGALQADGLPSQVDRLFGRVYDPDADADLFPGEFAERVESGQVPLNSAAFVWIVALDAQGNPVTDLSQAAVIRARIPPAQWPDLEDIQWGTDRIETPIYTFNEAEGIWEQMGVGWVEDGAANILAEEDQAHILDGSFQGDIFATFRTTHFSFMNVDYASYGPWTLSRIDREKRNNDCFFKALQLAKQIALSSAGQGAYGNVNQPGADLLDELADGKGPEIKTGDLDWSEDSQTNGEYNGDNTVGDNPEDEIVLNNKIWEFCDDSKPEQKKDIVLLLASTILHETAHWKDDVKKHPGANDTTAPDGPEDTAGEEGKQLERDLFGGDLHFDPDEGRLELDGEPIDGSLTDVWLNPDNWEDSSADQAMGAALPQAAPGPLIITISMAGSTFNTRDSIPVQVTYRNAGVAPIRVLNDVILEDYPLRFAITHVPSGKPVGFLGKEQDIGFGDGAFATLAPGQSLQKAIDLNRDELGRLARYNLRLGGTYQVKAIYTPFLGLPATESNTLSFTLNPGGSISGIVTALGSGAPVSGTLIYALLDDVIMGSAVSNVSGAYLLADVPGGSYLLTTRKAGFPRTNQPGVVVVAGQNTTANLVLAPPPHLSYGQTIAGTLEEPTVPISYTFSGKSNERVLFRLAEVDPALVPHVRVYRPDGSLLCESSSSTLAQTVCLLDRNGKYSIKAGSYGSEIGAFSLFLQSTSNPANDVAIAYGDSRNGTVAAVGAMVAYTFAGNAAERVLVRLAEVNPALVPDVRIYRPDGSLLCDSSSSTLAQEVCLLDVTGTHTILAGSYGSEIAAFSLFLQSTSNPANDVAIAYGESKSGTVAAVGAMVAYTFAGNAAERVLVRLAEVNPALVPDVRIYRPDGSLLCDSSSSTLAEAHCVLNITGTHTILAGSYGSETGAYTLSLAQE